MRVAWKPPEENPLLLINKNHPTGPPENHGVLYGAAKTLNKYLDNEHELRLSGMGPPQGTPTQALPSTGEGPSWVLHRAAIETQTIALGPPGGTNTPLTTSIPFCKQNLNPILNLPGRKCLASSVRNSYNSDPCRWTAVCTAHSHIHSSRDPDNVSYHMYQTPIMHSKIKNASREWPLCGAYYFR